MITTKAFTYPFMWAEHVKLFRRAVPRDVIVKWVRDDISDNGNPRMVYEVPTKYYPAWCAARRQARFNLLGRRPIA